MRAVMVAVTLCAVATVQAQVEDEAVREPVFDGWRQPSCEAPETRALVEQGRALMKAEDYRRAADLLGQAADVCVLRTDFMLDYGRALSMAGELGRGEDPLNRLAARHDGSPAVLLSIGNVQLIIERFDDAVATADRMLEKRPKLPQALKLKANALYLSGRDDEAKNLLIQAIKQDAEDAEAPYMLGRIYYQEQLYQHAVPQFERVLAINPQSYKAYDNLGLCYRALGETDKATDYFLKAMEVGDAVGAPYGWAHSNLAELLIQQGELDKAFKLAFRAVELDPAGARHYFLAGRALLGLDRAENSVRWFAKATELDPNDPASHYQLARALRQAGREDEAKAAFERFQEVRAKTPARRR